MGVDIVDVLRLHSGFLVSELHSHCAALSLGVGAGLVVCVAGAAVAAYLGVDLRAACLCVLVFLQHEEPAAVAEDEAASLRVERNGSPVNVRGARNCVHVVERSVAEADVAVLGPARDSRVKVAVLYRAESLADRLRAACAGCGDAEVASLEAGAYSHFSCGHVAYHLCYGENSHALVALVVVVLHFLFGGVDSADTAADDHADAVGVDVPEVGARVLQSLHCAVYRVLNDDVVAAELLFIEILGRVEVLYPRHD